MMKTSGEVFNLNVNTTKFEAGLKRAMKLVNRFRLPGHGSKGGQNMRPTMPRPSPPKNDSPVDQVEVLKWREIVSKLKALIDEAPEPARSGYYATVANIVAEKLEASAQHQF